MTRRMADVPSRRQYLKESVALAASANVVGAIRAEEKKKPPSERLNLGIIGCGPGSQGDYNLSNVTSENIVALCNVDSERAGMARQAHPKAATFRDFHNTHVLEGLDAVILSS